MIAKRQVEGSGDREKHSDDMKGSKAYVLSRPILLLQHEVRKMRHFILRVMLFRSC